MTVGQNVELQVKDGKLMITVDLSKTFGTSSSGKSVIIASTGGNVSVPVRSRSKSGSMSIVLSASRDCLRFGFISAICMDRRWFMTALDMWILILLMIIGFAWAAWAQLKRRR